MGRARLRKTRAQSKPGGMDTVRGRSRLRGSVSRVARAARLTRSRRRSPAWRAVCWSYRPCCVSGRMTMQKLSLGLIGLLLYMVASSIQAQGTCTLRGVPEPNPQNLSPGPLVSLPYQGGSVKLLPSCALDVSSVQLRRDMVLEGGVINCTHGFCPPIVVQYLQNNGSGEISQKWTADIQPPSGPMEPNVGPVTITVAAPLPSSCTLTSSPASLQAGGGRVTLTAACASGGAP